MIKRLIDSWRYQNNWFSHLWGIHSPAKLAFGVCWCQRQKKFK